MTKLGRADLYITAEDTGGTLEGIRRSVPDSWECLDCGMDTAPGFMNARQIIQVFEGGGKAAPQRFDIRSEVYQLKKSVWDNAAKKDVAGVFCIGCIEKRLGRKLRPRDFDLSNLLNTFPGTDRLISRKMGM